jgi:hypothetical protein
MFRRGGVTGIPVVFRPVVTHCRRNKIIKATSLLLASLVSTALFATSAVARGGGGRSHAEPSVTVPLQFDGAFPVIIVPAPMASSATISLRTTSSASIFRGRAC